MNGGVKPHLGLLARAGNLPFLMVIYAYRLTLSPIMGGQCRFEPTCSRYGIQAYKSFGPIRGTLMTGRRILRCNPFSKGGYDPVPIPSCVHESEMSRAKREHAHEQAGCGSNESEIKQ